MILDKIEKLIIAIYMVTEFISEKENIKFSIRDLSLKLLDINDNKKNNKNEYINIIYKLISKIRIAKNVNLISEMNSNILIEALEKLNKILSQEDFILDKIDFDIKDIASPRLRSAGTEEIIKDNQNYKIDKRQTEKIENKRQNDLLKLNTNNNIGQTNKQINKSILIQERKENRKDQILSLFVKDNQYGIKDIAKKIPGCSEKTVVRELDNLILEKKIKRIGERRWARYILS